MGKDFIIRPIAAEDAQAIETFFDRLDGEARVFFDTGGYNRLRFQNYFQGNVENFDCFVAYEPGAALLAGMVVLNDANKLVPMLGIGIDNAYSGCGLGVQLMEYIHSYARSRGMGGILLNVHYGNTRAQNLYMKMGYELIGHSKMCQMLYIKRFDAEK